MGKGRIKGRYYDYEGNECGTVCDMCGKKTQHLSDRFCMLCPDCVDITSDIRILSRIGKLKQYKKVE